jgi:ADP-heptose:LPS heptosyltransferase
MQLLVIRTSAMGDVALTIPVLTGMKEQYPDIEIVMLTRRSFSPFFTSIKGLKLFFPDLQSRHNGFLGLLRLYKDISSQYKIDYVIDLHDVLRSKILRILFKLSGVPVSVIDKGRGEKRSLITGRKKVQLKHSVDRYCDVFATAGFPVSPVRNVHIADPKVLKINEAIIPDTKDEFNIGVAPFAKHKLKIWPEEKMIQLLSMIAENRKVKFWLFGGNEDSGQMASFQAKVSGSVNLIGKITLAEELTLMSKLDMMIAMDSSNMHMAALAGTKVISIWGGTDPLSGFGAWNQPENFSISIPMDELTCRPCTIYGKGDCKRKDFACMNWLTPDMVLKKIEGLGLLSTGRQIK